MAQLVELQTSTLECTDSALDTSKQHESILVRNHVSLVGDITIPDGMTLVVDSDLNGASPQFTLTCISTGGPATTVTWTRDSATDIGDEMTVFNDVATVQYTHTLTVTGRLGGDYQCTVSNVKPSSPSASLRIQGTAYKLLHSNSVYTCIYIMYMCINSNVTWYNSANNSNGSKTIMDVCYLFGQLSSKCS